MADKPRMRKSKSQAVYERLLKTLRLGASQAARTSQPMEIKQPIYVFREILLNKRPMLRTHPESLTV